MLRDVLNSISGIGIYPTIALLIFFALFVGAIIYVFRMDKPYEKLMSELPLKDNSVSKGE